MLWIKTKLTFGNANVNKETGKTPDLRFYNFLLNVIKKEKQCIQLEKKVHYIYLLVPQAQ